MNGLMKSLGFALLLISSLAAHAQEAPESVTPAISVEVAIITGVIESTVLAKCHFAPPASAVPFVTIALPVFLPAWATAGLNIAYRVATPTLSIGQRTFTPVSLLPGAGWSMKDRSIPSNWRLVSFLFRLPPQLAGQDFEAKIIYIQPQIKNVTPFLPMTLAAGATEESKLTFVPGENHSLQWLTKNSHVSPPEAGMLIAQPVNGELLVVRRTELRPRGQVVDENEKKTSPILSVKGPLDPLLLFFHLKKPSP